MDYEQKSWIYFQGNKAHIWEILVIPLLTASILEHCPLFPSQTLSHPTHIPTHPLCTVFLLNLIQRDQKLQNVKIFVLQCLKALKRPFLGGNVNF